MTNEITYRTEINTIEDYKITIVEFAKWLAKNKETEAFGKELNKIEDVEDLYTVALLYSIPIIMVKWFLK